MDTPLIHTMKVEGGLFCGPEPHLSSMELSVPPNIVFSLNYLHRQVLAQHKHTMQGKELVFSFRLANNEQSSKTDIRLW